jgi:hypothetical protein
MPFFIAMLKYYNMNDFLKIIDRKIEKMWNNIQISLSLKYKKKCDLLF